MKQFAMPGTSGLKTEKLLDDFAGIYQQDGDNDIIVTCPECKEILFEGKEKQARRLIIYCTDCTK